MSTSFAMEKLSSPKPTCRATSLADFIAISGFSEQELLGAPQNIVRHPDMPVEAFADFWHTIKSGVNFRL